MRTVRGELNAIANAKPACHVHARFGREKQLKRWRGLSWSGFN